MGDAHQEVKSGNVFLEAALQYLALGWSVLALEPRSKKPIGRWEKYQNERASELHVRSWWRRTPNANVGIALGPVSGLIGIDLDGPEASPRIAQLAEKYGCKKDALEPVDTIAFQTGGGPDRTRLLYALPKGCDPPQHNEMDGKKKIVTFLTRGCQTVMPPSIHPDTGNQYEWIAGHRPGEIELAQCPAWILDFLDKMHRLKQTGQSGKVPESQTQKEEGPPVGRGSLSAYERATIELRKDREESPAIQGENGSGQLFKLACRLVKGYHLSREEALQLLRNEYNAWCRPPWSEKELQHKVDEAIAKGSYQDLLGKPSKKMKQEESARQTGQADNTPQPRKLFNPIPISQCQIIEESNRWLWQEIIGLGKITGLTAKAKDGKTTLLALLYKAMETNASFCNLDTTRPARIVIVSEEPKTEWGLRRDDLGLQDYIQTDCLPFLSKPRPADWQAYIQEITDWASANQPALIVFDTITHLWAIKNENDNSEMASALMPLRRISQTGAAVLVVHHLGKADNGSRGASEWEAFFDYLVEFRRQDGAKDDDRRRIIKCKGRYRGQPPRLTIELNADRTAYNVITSESFIPQPSTPDRLQQLLREITPPGATKEEIYDAWPWSPKPSLTYLANILSKEPKGRWIKILGKKGDPSRFHGMPSVSPTTADLPSLEPCCRRNPETPEVSPTTALTPTEEACCRRNSEQEGIIGTDGEDYTNSPFDEQENAA